MGQIAPPEIGSRLNLTRAVHGPGLNVHHVDG